MRNLEPGGKHYHSIDGLKVVGASVYEFCGGLHVLDKTILFLRTLSLLRVFGSLPIFSERPLFCLTKEYYPQLIMSFK